ncbi:hypothetical protein EU799_08915 [Corynebacterium silvaticum]|uniref:DUF5979 domain-containing protein n=1 Tax=Corynebacterium silvaticum TaxID=2320431 RepID=UPI0010672CA7|nr:DUF5979 domain-containing protein [Corynebacterium silvaticum]MBH5300283.1 hypothetical protein [Corynebacterium silvaticum]NOM65698.1 hypothetical protein [Corynebacterium silvaticum]TFA92122.1 hypothetical protein EU802_07880 [Corynebacterium silvaticum]TFA94931.1 hypothetical protein EU799_08915 [Corynebacterium silvaticum]TNX79145.1 hypothetical protein FIT55_09570 [Corynebacterium silvaticum]
MASNTYTPVPKGRFTVNKKLEGPAALLADEAVQNRKFKGQCRCGTQDWTQFEFSVKEPFVSPEYPEETSCHIEEHTNSTEISGFTWSGANDNNVNIQVDLINKYTQKVGGFKLIKFVDGPAASLAKDLSTSSIMSAARKQARSRSRKARPLMVPPTFLLTRSALLRNRKLMPQPV